jgi:hypothetical protein
MTLATTVDTEDAEEQPSWHSGFDLRVPRVLRGEEL